MTVSPEMKKFLYKVTFILIFLVLFFIGSLIYLFIALSDGDKNGVELLESNQTTYSTTYSS